MTIFMDPVTVSTDDHRHGGLSARMTISTDGYLQNIDRSIDTSCRLTRHQHGGLLAWMAIFMAPVTISTANYRHGWLPAWILLYIVIFLQDTSMDDHLQNIDRSIDTSC